MNSYVIAEKLDQIEQKIDNKVANRWLTTHEVVKYTGLSISTIHRALKRGELKVHQGTGKNLFRRGDVDKWIKG